MSSSTEDLKLLFDAEKEIIKFLKTIIAPDEKTNNIMERYLQSVDFDEKTEQNDYVKHPINAFHLLQRTSRWIPKLKKVIPNLHFNFTLPSVTDAIFEASNGLADILEYYNLQNPIDFVKGQIQLMKTGEIYQAKSNLTSFEILKVASAARKAQYFHGYVR